MAEQLSTWQLPLQCHENQACWATSQARISRACCAAQRRVLSSESYVPGSQHVQVQMYG
jgi:hypothetical protein